ncbi:MAG: DegT/DnrJ/EryC1/StrS family aminotransferase [Candidatus Sumerlaeota bacterium]|nr:DegT/DnrJ/EryC1/StrS family aminotransferase [Candidatus Sumerlaeota bacterium]
MPALALNGGTPVRTIPFPPWPVFDEREERALVETLRSGVWGIPRPRVEEFEEKFAAYHDARFAVACTSGSTALKLAILACGIGTGDEIIVPPYTFIATATCVLLCNAVPIFADIDPETFNLDPRAIDAAVTPRTKAIIPVHLGGCPCDMDGIGEAAKKHGLRVIEDACQAHGAEWKGRKVGAIGDLGCFSFQSSKNLTCGEGGAVASDDEALAETVDSIHDVGRMKGKGFYEHYGLGTNYRMNEFQAALLLCGLERLPEQTARRNRNGTLLRDLLRAVPAVAPQKVDPRVTSHAYHLFPIRYRREFCKNLPRERFLAALQAEGIPCSLGYTPLYRAPLFRNERYGARGCPASCPYHGEKPDYSKVFLPVVEQVCGEMVWFQQRLLLGTEQDTRDIADAIAKVVERYDELL